MGEIQTLEELEAEEMKVLLLVQRPMHILHKVLSLRFSHGVDWKAKGDSI
jgi:hypothetical protein